MHTLYVISGSKLCEEAENLLRKKNLKFSIVDVEASGLLGCLDWEIGIRTLPSLDMAFSRYQGIEEIRRALAQL